MTKRAAKCILLPVNLSETQKKIINLLGGDLPVTKRPFALVAKEVGVTEEEVVDIIRDLSQKGVLRRFGATLKHQNSGFAANVLVAWRVPEERIDEVGHTVASSRNVTHCYHRRPHKNFPYNLYSMFHAATEDQCKKMAAEMAEQVGIDDYDLLFSTEELKKTSPRYFENEEG